MSSSPVRYSGAFARFALLFIVATMRSALAKRAGVAGTSNGRGKPGRGAASIRSLLGGGGADTAADAVSSESNLARAASIFASNSGGVVAFFNIELQNAAKSTLSLAILDVFASFKIVSQILEALML